MHPEMPEPPAPVRTPRESARVCLLAAFALCAPLMLARDAWPESAIVRALSWPTLASAATLLVVGRFVVGRGLDWHEAPNDDVDRSSRVQMIVIGSVLMLAFGVGWLVFDDRLARAGGVPGLMRSLGLFMSGGMLVGWGVYTPTWLFLRDESEPHAEPPKSRAWVAVYTGPVSHAVCVRLTLEQAGFRTFVPETNPVWCGPNALTTSVLVPAPDAPDALRTIEDDAKPADPRSDP